MGRPAGGGRLPNAGAALKLLCRLRLDKSKRARIACRGLSREDDVRLRFAVFFVLAVDRARRMACAAIGFGRAHLRQFSGSATPWSRACRRGPGPCLAGQALTGLADEIIE
jgi:hypothetical protein